jgi:hypothetical protein
VSASLHASFGEDGKFVMKTVASGPNGTSVTSTDTGTWTLAGDKLTHHVDDVQWDFSGPDAVVARARQRFQQNRSKIIANVNKDPTETIAWTGNDEFTATDSSGHKETFHRVQ